MNSADPNKLCPSSDCSKGAVLIGIVQQDHTVTLLENTLPIDATFIEKASQPGVPAPEKRFRFARPCAKGGCKQWNGTACTVISTLDELNKGVWPDEHEGLRPCAIRDRCRWFSQIGKKACSMCKYVVTDNREETPL